jgi:hypothetical protein
MDLIEIRKIFENGGVEEAEGLLELFDGEKEANYWLLKARINQKKQLWGKAINDFQKVLEIDEENKEAKTQVEMVKNILGFWNPEMFNV